MIKTTPKFERLLSKWGVWSAKNKGKTLLIALAITLIMTIGLALLQMEMTFYSIMPQSTQKAKDLKVISNEFPMANSIFLVIEGEDPELLKQAVDAVSAELKKEEYADIISQVKGKMDLESLSGQLIYLSAGEADNNLPLEQDPVKMITVLNSEIEKTLANNDLNLTEKERLHSQLTVLENILNDVLNKNASALSAENNISNFFTDSFLPNSYLINEDQDMAIVLVLPEFTINDLSTVPKVKRIDHGAKQFEKQFNVKIGSTGMAVVGKDEMVTSEQGIVASSMIAFVLIILLLIRL